MNNFLFERESVLGSLRSSVFVAPSTLAHRAATRETLEKVIAVCGVLANDDFTKTMTDAYRLGLEKFGESWGYVDITSLLYAVAELGKPKNYLEIGVRRGRSACMVAAASVETAIYGFDMWQKDYANNGNPGANFVEAELAKVGHKGQRHFVDGDSHKTVPEFFRRNPDINFDLITVDGDHSLSGAWDDLTTVVARLNVGGVIVFDDIDNPYCPGLLDVWKRFLATFPQLSGQTIPNPLGLGVSFAIRLTDGAAIPLEQKKLRRATWLKWR